MKLILYCPNNEYTELKLSETESAYSVNKILDTQKTVFEDKPYDISFVLADNETPVSIQIDDDTKKLYPSQTRQDKGVIKYAVQKLFKDRIGIVQIKIVTESDLGQEKIYYSEYASVLVPSNKNNKQIEMMLNYIYENQPNFLYHNQKTYGVSKDIGIEGDEGFWSQAQLIEEVASVYESLYGYFKANRRYYLKPVKQLDNTDKLQYVESETMQHMVQHPEFLRRSLYGIKHGGEYYLPDKVLMTKNIISYDTYENRLIVSFLRKVYLETNKLIEKINDYLSNVPDQTGRGGYIVSYSLLFKVAVDALKEYQRTLINTRKKLKTLLSSYQRLFGFQEMHEMQSCPRPTPVMRSVPQYNIIYMCMIKWFTNKGYEFKAEDTMLQFINISSVYEIYVLVKLIRTIIEEKYSLIESYKKDYGLKESQYYHNTAYNNTFIFEKEDTRLSIYYTPVIYNGFAVKNESISLYRNSSVSFPTLGDGVNHTGSYYVPDYIIKVEQNEEEKYLICDAKYRRFSTVKAEDGPKLGYKYLLSISPSKPNAKIVGLNIIFGKTDDHVDTESFYDTQGNTRTAPQYLLELTPLAEDVPVQNQTNNLQNIFGALF